MTDGQLGDPGLASRPPASAGSCKCIHTLGPCLILIMHVYMLCGRGCSLRALLMLIRTAVSPSLTTNRLSFPTGQSIVDSCIMDHVAHALDRGFVPRALRHTCHTQLCSLRWDEHAWLPEGQPDLGSSDRGIQISRACQSAFRFVIRQPAGDLSTV